MNDTITNDITTRLLAQENLLIHRAPVRTASFDVVNRVLTLPQWQQMTPVIEEMLKAHEVGHALYTDETIFAARRSAINAEGVPFSYLNILEDVRIERIMKSNFPGLRKTFTEGYRQMMELDFFELKNRDLSKLHIADKINVYFKVGFKSGIKFTSSEQVFVDRANRMETIDDVVELSRDIFAYAKAQQMEKQKKLMTDDDFLDMLDGMKVEKDQEELDLDLDEIEYESMSQESDDDSVDLEDETHHSGGVDERLDNIGWDNEEHDLSPSTMTAFDEKLQALADVNTKFHTLSMVNYDGYFDKIIIPYQKVLHYNENATQRMIDNVVKNGYEHRIQYIKERAEVAEKDYEKFQSETTKVVAYLTKEFEMRKAASNYKRSQISKTGVLDVTKLASYKIREDLFKQITITKDGQKHGMLFVLDWSGSMNEYLVETVKQLISLAQFCYRVNIPFQVFAFSDNGYLSCDDMDAIGTGAGDTTWHKRIAINDMIKAQSGNNYLRLAQYFSMLELLSSKMKLSEFKRACKTVFMMSHQICHENFETHGTPLNEALAFMYDYVGQFKKTHNVEKLTLIKLTDGDGGNVNGFVNEANEDIYLTHSTYDLATHKNVRMVYNIVDKYTRKVYSVDRYETIWGNVLTEMIRDRYDCNVIGFHVVKTNPRHLAAVLQTYGAPFGTNDVYPVRRDLTKEQFAAVNVRGHNELFFLRANMRVDDTELKDDFTNMSAAAIARNFSKHMSGKKTSRILLNKFIGVVA